MLIAACYKLIYPKSQPKKDARMHEETVRSILTEHSKLSIDLSTLASDSDLYEAGLTSLTTVNVMLAIEDHFDVEFEDSMLARATFQSVDSLVDAVEELLEHVYPHLQSGAVKPLVDSIYPLEEVEEAHSHMESGEHMGKIILRCSN